MDKNKSFWVEIQEKYEIADVQYVPACYFNAGLMIEFELRSKQERPPCGICNGKPNIHDYTSKEVTFGTLNGCPAVFRFKHCRYWCKRCDITFVEEFDCLAWHSGMTTDARNYILSRLGSQTFTDIAADIGYSVQSISNVARGHAASERETQLAGRYRFLSMDEIFVSRNQEGKSTYYWVLNDISTPWKSNNIRVDVGRNKDDVAKRLGELGHPERVEAVCIDMWKPYRDAIHEALPGAAVVIDPFHVIQAAQREMENVRKRAKVGKEMKAALKKDSGLFLTSIYKLSGNELDRLELYLRASAELEKAYFIVQEIAALYHMDNFEDALKYLASWETGVLESNMPEMASILNTVQNWLPYILNHFIYRISNGKTEGKNHMLRVIDKMGFHYGIDALQGCIYAHDRKQEYLKWRRLLRRRAKPLKPKPSPPVAA